MCVCVCVSVSYRGNYLTYCIYYVDISVRVKIMHFKYMVSLQTDKGTIQKALLTRSPSFLFITASPYSEKFNTDHIRTISIPGL